MAKKSLVDPDTGYTPQEQIARFNEIFSLKVKRKPEVAEVIKVTKTKKAKEPVDMKAAAVKLYEGGKDAKQVAEALNISYASAYYYKKFVGQEKAKERLKMALKRI